MSLLSKVLVIIQLSKWNTLADAKQMRCGITATNSMSKWQKRAHICR